MIKQKHLLPYAILRLFPLFKNRNVDVPKNENSLTAKERSQTNQSKKRKFNFFKKWLFKKESSAQKQMSKNIFKLDPTRLSQEEILWRLHCTKVFH